MKGLRRLTVVVVTVMMLMWVQMSSSQAQQTDTERLRTLEQQMLQMQQELDLIRKDQVNIPTFPKLHITLGVSITVRYDLTDVEDQTDIRLEDDRIEGFRTRDRFWVYFEPDGPVQAGVRLSTGEDPNPTSPFIRMGNIFRADSFNLDQFFIVLRPIKLFDMRPYAEHAFQMSFHAGKMPNPFWTGDRGEWRSEMIWDTDVQPEGIALKLRFPRLGSILDLESTTAYFQIQEVDDFRFAGLTADTYMVATQLRAQVKLLTLAFAFYNYENLNAGLEAPNFAPGSGAFISPGQAAILLRPGVQHTNNQVDRGPGAIAFVRDRFQVINASAQLYIPLPIASLAPEIFLFGDYINNLSVARDEQGYSVTLGLRGGGKPGSVLNAFSLWFTYRNVDNDATLSTFADSDLGAGTGYRGFEAAANYRLHKNLLFQVSGFLFEAFPNKDNTISRVFFDLVANF